uniref:Uncharacterized protein n=1 Tax=Cacopsylla melanoneura TaxID=428564 RepID=A0A8D8UXU4_9HEMI
MVLISRFVHCPFSVSISHLSAHFSISSCFISSSIVLLSSLSCISFLISCVFIFSSTIRSIGRDADITCSATVDVVRYALANLSMTFLWTFSNMFTYFFHFVIFPHTGTP